MRSPVLYADRTHECMCPSACRYRCLVKGIHNISSETFTAFGLGVQTAPIFLRKDFSISTAAALRAV